MKRFVLLSIFSVAVITFAVTSAFAADLALYSGPTNPGWISPDAAVANAETIMNDAQINDIFESIDNYGDGDEVGADSPLGLWMMEHTGNGQQDVFIAASGTAPSAIYQFPNADPDGSNIENFIEDGNVFINVADWILYMSYEGGTRSTDNGPSGAANVFDIEGLSFGARGGPQVPTEAGEAYLPSLVEFQSDRPWHLEQFDGSDWEVTAFAMADDGISADPAVAVHTTEGGIIAAMWQKAQPDWDGEDPRGVGVIEFITNWLMEHGSIATPVEAQGKVAVTWGHIKAGR